MERDSRLGTTAVVVFLLWIYVCAVILLYGVEMTAAYARLQDAAERHAHRRRPPAVSSDGRFELPDRWRR